MALNRDVQQFLQALPTDVYSFQAGQNALSKSPDEFKTYVTAKEAAYRAALRKFIAGNTPGELFERWADSYIRYEALTELIRYPWESPYHTHTDPDSLKLKNSYFSFLEAYNMADSVVLTFSHAQFLHELSKHVAKHNRTAYEKKDQLYTSSGGTLADHFANIASNTEGFTRELVYAKLFNDLLNAQMLPQFESLYRPSLVPNRSLGERVKNNYGTLKAFLKNQDTGQANLFALSGAAPSELLARLTEKFKNKVVYIDFWAPWCAPCMAEMPEAKALQASYKGQDVVFLFLANRTTDASWKATIANNALAGEHVNLTEDQFNKLADELGIAGIPLYALINKAGKLVNRNAPRPSEAHELKKLLAALLD